MQNQSVSKKPDGQSATQTNHTNTLSQTGLHTPPDRVFLLRGNVFEQMKLPRCVPFAYPLAYHSNTAKHAPQPTGEQDCYTDAQYKVHHQNKKPDRSKATRQFLYSSH